MDRDELEMKIYSKLCSSCPNARQCHEECETCEEYDKELEEGKRFYEL